MNDLSTTQNSGLLKSFYPGSTQDPVLDALKKKREKLAETKLGLEPKEG